RFLGGCLAYTTGDPHDKGPAALAGGLGKIAKAGQRVAHADTPLPLASGNQCGDGAVGKRRVDEIMTVEAIPLDGHEQRLRPQFARVDGDGIDLGARNTGVPTARGGKDGIERVERWGHGTVRSGRLCEGIAAP